jgi:hypothetical protein
METLEMVETVEMVQAELGRLVSDRQRLREFVAGRERLERNRLAIVAGQQRLNLLLINRYLPSAGLEQAA